MQRPGGSWSTQSLRPRAPGCSPPRAPRCCCACPRGRPHTTRSAPPPHAAHPRNLLTRQTNPAARQAHEPGAGRQADTCLERRPRDGPAHADVKHLHSPAPEGDNSRRAWGDGRDDVGVIYYGGHVGRAGARQLHRHARGARNGQARGLRKLRRRIAQPDYNRQTHGTE